MPHVSMEERAKRSEALKSHFKTDLGDTEIGLDQQRLRSANPLLRQIFVGSDAIVPSEQAVEVIAREVGTLSDRLEIYGVIEVVVDELTCLT